MFMVVCSSEFNNHVLTEFDGFNEACEFAGDKYAKGFDVEILKVEKKKLILINIWVY